MHGCLRRPARAAAARPGSEGRRRRCAGSRSASRRRARRADEIVHDEHQRQGATNVTVRNVITSMRLISDVDWAELVRERRASSTTRCGRQRLRARWISRRATSTAARSRSSRAARGCRSSRSRERRWRRAPALPADGDADDRAQRDPGYHLIAGGRPRVRARRSASARRCGAGSAASTSRLGIARLPRRDRSSLAALVLALPLLGAGGCRRRRPAGSCCSRCSALIPAIDAGDRAREPRRHRGASARRSCRGSSCATACPRELRTLVAVPTCSRRAPTLEEQIERLEVHYLASPDGELHFALLSDWTDADDETRRGRRRAARRGRRGHRAAEPRATGRPPAATASSCSTAGASGTKGERRWMGWERKRGKLHELNRLLRGATDTTFVRRRRTRAARARRRPLRHHARRRYAAAARRRAPAGRQDGASAQPAALRRRARGAWSRATACCSRASRRRCRSAARARSSSASSPARAASIPTRPRSPTSTRTSSARAPTPARASTTSTPSRPRSPAACRRTRCSATISSRASSRAPASPPTSSSSRSSRRATTSPPARQHRWARGDWQLLPWILGRAPGDATAPADRPLEDARQPAAHRSRRRRRFARAGRRLDAAAAPPRWSGPRSSVDASRCPRCLPVVRRLLPRRAGISLRSHLRALGRRSAARRSRRSLLHGRVPGAPGLADGRRDRAHAVRLFVTPPASARMGHGGAGEGRARGSTSRGFYRRMAGGVALARRRGRRRGRGRRRTPGRSALPFVLAVARCRRRSRAGSSLPPRVARPRSPVSPADARALRLIARRTWRFFETFVDADGQHAAARQLPGGPEAGRRAPHLADQPRPLPPRPRSPRATSAGSARSRPSSGWRRRSRRWAGSSASAATSTTGTTRATCGRSSRSTSPRSTAATSPGT